MRRVNYEAYKLCISQSPPREPLLRSQVIPPTARKAHRIEDIDRCFAIYRYTAPFMNQQRRANVRNVVLTMIHSPSTPITRPHTRRRPTRCP